MSLVLQRIERGGRGAETHRITFLNETFPIRRQPRQLVFASLPDRLQHIGVFCCRRRDVGTEMFVDSFVKSVDRFS